MRVNIKSLVTGVALLCSAVLVLVLLGLQAAATKILQDERGEDCQRTHPLSFKRGFNCCWLWNVLQP